VFELIQQRLVERGEQSLTVKLNKLSRIRLPVNLKLFKPKKEQEQLAQDLEFQFGEKLDSKKWMTKSKSYSSPTEWWIKRIGTQL